MDNRSLIILCPLVFFAGLVDSIAGGGGLISLPAYIACGIPVHTSIATNKFSATAISSTSSIRYILNRKADLKVALTAAGFALVGSFAGAKAVQTVDAAFLRYLLIAVTPVIAFFVLRNKNLGVAGRRAEIGAAKTFALSLAIGLALGFYDGFYGPGMGTFLIMAFTGLLGYDFVTASGNAKIVNLASNVAALAAYILDKKVLFLVGLPCAACGIAGSYIGSGLAIKKGARFMRPVFGFVLALIMLYILNDALGIF